MSKTENYESEILNELFEEITPKELKKVEDRMLLAQKISEGIKAKGWKKIDFARALNKRPSEITKWLSGTHNFNSDTLFDIQDILEIELINTENKTKEQVITFKLSVNQEQHFSKSDINVFFYEDNLSKSLPGGKSHLSLSQEIFSNSEYQA